VESADDALGAGDGAALVAAAGLTSADASDGVCCCLLHPMVAAAIRTSRPVRREEAIRRGFMLRTL